MNAFVNAAVKQNQNAKTRTTNGMKARVSTANSVLDLFGEVGSSRGKDLTKSFFSAIAEDENLALRVLLWARDIRGGAGERQTFRNLLSKLESTNPATAAKLMHKIPELGRWDDLFAYTDPLNRRKAFDMIGKALADKNGLCAKWMPRKGNLAEKLRVHLGWSFKRYRKTLVTLTQVVETQMCAKEWDTINFSHIPSVASARYQKAFGRNAKEAYSAYIAELKKPVEQRDPKVKINAGAVYPYDVVTSVIKGNAAVADEQWKALPNYVNDTRILPMVDVSGSMGALGYNYGNGPSPMTVAISLGLYLADKNTSDFKDMFLTFSGSPELLKLKGDLSQKMSQMARSTWAMNTDLNKAFELVLKTAVKGKVPQADMPQILLILSDMQFDACARYDDTAIKMIERKYSEAGYAMPKIVFWNLNGGYGNVPVKFDKRGTAHVSGFSPAIMKSVLANDLEDFTPYNVMLKTIMDSRYDF